MIIIDVLIFMIERNEILSIDNVPSIYMKKLTQYLLLLYFICGIPLLIYFVFNGTVTFGTVFWSLLILLTLPLISLISTFIEL